MTQGQIAQASSLLIASLNTSQVQKLSQNDSLPQEFLKPNQYKLYADLVKADGAYEQMGILKPGMSDEQIVSLPVWVNFILTASIAVKSGRQESMWEPAFKYSHPTPFVLQPSGNNPNFNRLARPQPAERLARNKALFQSVKPLMLAEYPAGLPLPEMAFIRQFRVPFTALSSTQQKFVKSIILNSEDALPQPFDWNKATVSFARTLVYRGGVRANEPPLYTKVSGFDDQLW